MFILHSPLGKSYLKVPQVRLLCHTHVDNKKKQVFEKFFSSLLCNQTPVESLKPQFLGFLM